MSSLMVQLLHLLALSSTLSARALAQIDLSDVFNPAPVTDLGALIPPTSIGDLGGALLASSTPASVASGKPLAAAPPPPPPLFAPPPPAPPPVPGAVPPISIAPPLPLVSNAPFVPTAQPMSLFGPPVIPVGDLPAPGTASLLGPPAAGIGPLPGAPEVGMGVQTTSGMIIGHEADERPEISEYLGIPYAIPPVGPLRFQAPKKFSSQATIINATSFGNDCPVNVMAGFIPKATSPGTEILNNLGQVGRPMSEDCLTLNVWTSQQTGAKSKAVLVYIHGGGFESGNTASPVFNGQYLANDENVVVVTMNYRLNVFGFPGLPKAPSNMTQNPGLLDQRMAVEWVRDNVAAFGGDPQRITLMGQSTGATSVDLYSYAYTRDPIVNGFITNSGSATSFANPARLNNSAAWFNATKILGCGDETTPLDMVVDCMRSKSMEDMLMANSMVRGQTAPNVFQSVVGTFGPTIDNKTVFSNYQQRARDGNFIQRPILTGNNNYEAGIFRVLTSSRGVNVTDMEWCLFNVALFTCPMSAQANSRAFFVPTFRYRYFGDLDSTRLTTDSRAYHGSELPLIFGTTQRASQTPLSLTEDQIQRQMQDLWMAFIRDPQEGLLDNPENLSTFTWMTRSMIELAVNNSPSPQLARAESTDSMCNTLAAIESKIPGGFPGLLSRGGSLMELMKLPDNKNIPGIKNLLDALDAPLVEPTLCPAGVA